MHRIRGGAEGDECVFELYIFRENGRAKKKKCGSALADEWLREYVSAC